MIGSIIDVLFFSLCVVVFGTIIWYNITSKARKRLRQHERTKRP